MKEKYSKIRPGKKKVAQLDIDNLVLIRQNVNKLVKKAIKETRNKSSRSEFIFPTLLVIGVGDEYECFKTYNDISIKTLDINPKSGASHIGDICKRNRKIKDNSFDSILLTEVLEHTLNPFKAAEELYRILKPGGKLYISTPFNFRIHGPLPDCWRFTKFGLQEVFKKFRILELKSLEDKNRFLMPLHYTLICEKI